MVLDSVPKFHTLDPHRHRL